MATVNSIPKWSGAASITESVIGNICAGRLTLTTATPVTTADVTAATTLYFTPYRGNAVMLYTGSKWVLHNLTELSIAVPATTVTMYDVFLDYNSGTPQLALTAWTDDTTRATALTTQDGVYVKNGDTEQRYIGNMRTTGSSGQTEDSLAKRFVWNYYNRVRRPMRVIDTTDSWEYTTATFRQARGSTANQLDYIVGVQEDVVEAMVYSIASNSAAGTNIRVGIGVDSTSDPTTAGLQLGGSSVTAVAGEGEEVTSFYSGFPGIGRHYLARLEFSEAAGTTTWLGDFGAADGLQTGIQGSIFG